MISYETTLTCTTLSEELLYLQDGLSQVQQPLVVALSSAAYWDCVRTTSLLYKFYIVQNCPISSK